MMRQHFRYYGLRKGLWWMVADAALWLHRAAVKRTVPRLTTPTAPEPRGPAFRAEVAEGSPGGFSPSPTIDAPGFPGRRLDPMKTFDELLTVAGVLAAEVLILAASAGMLWGLVGALTAAR